MTWWLRTSVLLASAAVGTMGAAETWNFIAIGDWGNDSPGQHAAARGMGVVAAEINANKVFCLGDNFYGSGIHTPADGPDGEFRFKKTFEDVYNASSLEHIPFYAIAGNHDYGGNVTAQLAYAVSHKGKTRWTYPNWWYNVTEHIEVGGKQLEFEVLLFDSVIGLGNSDVMLDDGTMHELGGDELPGPDDPHTAEQQWEWLEGRINSSTADYLWVGGHYPVWSIASHGPSTALVERLRPLLHKYEAHYFNGHDHDLEHIKENGSAVNYVTTGSGMSCCYEDNNLDKVPKGSVKFAMVGNRGSMWEPMPANYNPLSGFTSYRVGTDSMTVVFHGHDGRVLYTTQPILPRTKIPQPPLPPLPPPTTPPPTTPPPPPGPMPSGCFTEVGKDYKFAPGGLFPSTPTYPHGMRPVDTAAQCCDLCKSFKNCSFWTYENGGTVAKPQCYQYKQACCILKTDAANGGAANSPKSISGSMKPVDKITCRNGTQCGGTNEWTTWHDTTLPNSTCTPATCNPGTMPYPPSKDLVGWEFKSGCNPGYGSGNVAGSAASSADTFFPSWAADGNLYTGFTDGHVVDSETQASISAHSEGSAPRYTVTHGQAAIVGDDPFALNMTKVKTFSNQSAWPYGGRFPGGQLVYKGTWWYSTYYVPQYPNGPSSGPDNVLHGGLLGPLADFRHSLDMGETWEEPLRNATSDADNLFGETGPDPLHGKPASGPERVKMGTPHWVDFGQELEHSPDGKAYIVAHGATSPTSTEMWMLGDQVYLARVAPTVATIGDKTKWEFYAGGHGSAAKWVVGDVSKATPLVEFTNHTGSTTMTYFAGIKKYVMSINTASNYPVMDGGDFDTWFLEADDITGPWSMVTYMKNFGPQVYFANFPSKFSAKQADTSAQTYDAFLMYSANYDPHTHTSNPPNSGYHMNLQQARFSLSDAFAARLAQQ